MNSLSALTLLPSKKSEVQTFSHDIISRVNAGEINPLQLRVNIKAIEVALAEINDATKDLQLTEANKYGAKSFETFGAKVEVSELATKYDYSGCNDLELLELQRQFDEIDSKLKDRRKFLQTLSRPIEQVSAETGEMYTINPATKKSTTGLKVTLL